MCSQTHCSGRGEAQSSAGAPQPYAEKPDNSKMEVSSRVTKRMALQNSLPAPSPKSLRRNVSEGTAAMSSADSADQDCLFSRAVTMFAAPAPRKTAPHVAVLAPPDIRTDVIRKHSPQRRK